MDKNHPSLQTLEEIRRMMEQSSRFMSLSGLSGIAAGICAVGGAIVANAWINQGSMPSMVYGANDGWHAVEGRYYFLAAAVLVCALAVSFYFTWRKARNSGLPVWNFASRRLVINLLIPLIAGGIFSIALIYNGKVELIGPSTLIFYGLGLVNASKFTLNDIRYLGLLEIALGLVNMFFLSYGLVFWAIGFGLLHILYGLIIWKRYDGPPTGEMLP